MSEYYVGQIFTDEYPPEAAEWCNNSQGTVDACYIDEIEPEDEHRRFEIKSNGITPEDIEKSKKLARINELQYFLDSTDWYCSRYVDIGTPIPDDIKQQRSDARIEIDRLRHELEPSEEVESDTEVEKQQDENTDTLDNNTNDDGLR